MSEGDILCKYCGTFLTSGEPSAAAVQEAPQSKTGRIVLIIVIILVIAGLLVYFLR
ncbi:hypothetical protein N0M98_26370 [Paenibacillus doosanensis]|uniref:hypothetical protein n=1 Tax=Paenibacillus TaxID=44249 RepID=UPI00201D5519|nr:MULTISPECIES: hypothetical protein [Paenibacillus]MCS7463636.1 hypothetical protein [Paenibacillus doosanensis]